MGTLINKYTKGKLIEALTASVKLQARYAVLLNQQDGGRRRIFTTATEWMQRLKEVREDDK